MRINVQLHGTVSWRQVGWQRTRYRDATLSTEKFPECPVGGWSIWPSPYGCSIQLGGILFCESNLAFLAGEIPLNRLLKGRNSLQSRCSPAGATIYLGNPA